jgi:hypothetical protein
MLRSLKEIMGYGLNAEDGDIGRCHDFLLDEQTWTVRYMVADTGKWLPGRKVLISPISLGNPDWRERQFPVRLTRDQIESAPDLDEHAPVSREYEIWYHKHFQWPYYWSGAGLWSSGIHPKSLYVSKPDLGDEGPEFDHPHLHSCREVIGYDIGAKDGEIGHVEDFIVDDDIWAIQYAVVATRNWLPGKRVLIPLTRLEQVSWDDRVLTVDLTREAIKDAPEYDPSAPVNREYEERIYDFVGRPHNWHQSQASGN